MHLLTHRFRDCKAHGFTLLELMLAITVAAVILGVGVPSFRQFIMNSRITTPANDLLVAVHLARTESIKRHAQTVFCLTSDPAAEQPSCDDDGSAGWVVFVDDADPSLPEAGDNNLQVDAGEEVILRHAALHESLQVRAMPVDHASYVAFNEAGFSLPGAGDDVVSLVLCDSRGNEAASGGADSTARALVISATGRPRITRLREEIIAAGGCP